MQNTAESEVKSIAPVTPAVETVSCEGCSEVIPLADARSHGRDSYCETCYDDIFCECYDCNDMIVQDASYSDNDDTLCRSCYQNRENNREDDSQDTTGEIPERSFSTADLPQFQSTTAGLFITSQRIFSAEIEAYYPDTDILADVCNELPRAFGVSSDGSLNENGVEFQTPKLQGEAGEQSIIDTCRILNANDFTADRSTGLHIHLDGKGLIPKTRTKTNPRAIKEMWMFYLLYEDVLMSFLPPSRRTNRFCSLLKNDFHLAEIQACNNLVALERLWYRTQKHGDIKKRKAEKYDSSRYAGVNIHSLLANGHIEIRYHSGTINSTKILEWVNLHQTILDLAVAGDSISAGNVASLCDLKEKTTKFYEQLRLPTRARQYFTARQQLFTSTRKDNDEQKSAPLAVDGNEIGLDTAIAGRVLVNEPSVCVG